MFRFYRQLPFLIWILLTPSQTHSSSVGWQSSIVLSNLGMEFIPTDEQALFLYETSANSIASCTKKCHSTANCRVFNFDSQSHRCRIYEGDMNTMGSVAVSSSAQAVVGSIQVTTELFASRGLPCSFCENSRYLTCINSVCECPFHTFFNGTMCQSQKLVGARCLYSTECRNDRNLTCLSHLRCGSLSFNQPTFCSNVSWNQNATSFANVSYLNTYSWGFFIDINNSLYAAVRNLNRIQVWLENNTIPTRTLSGNLSGPVSIFVTFNGDIYVENGLNYGRIDKWTLNGNTSVPVMYVPGQCFGLFVDIENNIYCSATNQHVVIKSLSYGSINTSTIIAGNGSNGSASNMLSFPNGIFVDVNFNLYVADRYNHRIQFFQFGQTNATTVAGSTAAVSFALNYPSYVTLDGDGYLFIVDTNNNRIVASGPNGFRCVVACTGTSGATVDKFNFPTTMSFDSHGNMFVFDANNHRIQKFTLATNSCVT